MAVSVMVTVREMRALDQIRVGGLLRTILNVELVLTGARIQLSTGEQLSLAAHHEYRVLRRGHKPRHRPVKPAGNAAATAALTALAGLADPVALIELDDASTHERAILAEPVTAEPSPWCQAARAATGGGWEQLHTTCRAPEIVEVPGGLLQFICSCTCHNEPGAAR
jgi:hypothetical protein